MRTTWLSWVSATTAAALLLPGTLLSACLAQQGAPCSLDSDCLAGLVCALDGVCRPPDQARPHGGGAAPADASDRDALHADSANSADSEPGDAGPSPDATGCTQPGDTWVCGGAYAKHTVTNLALPSEGHGAARLAVVANPILEDSFAPSADTPIHLELWVDGTLAAGCAPHTAWVRGPDDVGAPDSGCQPVFLDAMPVDLPGLVSMVVYDAVLDPATLVVTGLLDVDEVVASMAPALQETARGMFDLDVDTDDDGTPDMCSVIIQVTL